MTDRMQNFIKKVDDYIIKNELIGYGDGIVLGLSGGADSVCLLRVLCLLRDKYKLTIHAVHVNHGIRGNEAKRDEEFSLKLANECGVSCHVVHADIPALAIKWKMTEEEAGRKVRYEEFAKASESLNCKLLAVAHHANDQAETVLFRMCRGTGIKGMCGMLPKRDNIIRPLLCVTKGEIYDFLNDIEQNYVEDNTNTCIEYDRNRIRENVIPELEHINSQSVAHICAMADRLLDVKKWFDQECDKAFANIVTVNPTHTAAVINTEKLCECQQVAATEVIRKTIGQLTKSMKDIEDRHIKLIYGLRDMENGKELHLPYCICARKEYENITLYVDNKNESGEDGSVGSFVIWPQEEKMFSDFECDGVYLPDEKKYYDHLKVSIRDASSQELTFENMVKNVCTKYVSCDKIKGRLVIRRPMDGDIINMGNNGTKKLSRYMIDKKIPRSLRDRLLVAASGNNVYLVFGGIMAKDVYVKDKKDNVLRINYLGE